MKSLYLRIYLTVVAVLLLFAAVSGWVFQRHLEQQRERVESLLGDRMAAWGELLQRSLPGPTATPQEQAEAVQDWSQRLRLPIALDDAQGVRIVASESFLRRQDEEGARIAAVRLDDGRTLWIVRPRFRGPPRAGGPPDLRGGPPGALTGDVLLPFLPPNVPRGLGVALFLSVLFLAVAAGAYPVVRRLTRRLEALKRGVERFGSGQLDHRVEVSGRDEVAAVAASFNRAASRVEALLQSNRSLLANASHELRSPLARMKMAVSMLDEVSPQQRIELKREIETNVAELDALVEEVLLASRLDAAESLDRRDRVDLLGLVAEEASRVDAEVDGPALQVQGDERLLRRALRNLLENARRYGGAEVKVELARSSLGVEVRVCDRGPGVPEGLRERIFEPFYRLPGHAEQAGGVGLGLSLVRQIAQRHGGSVRCEARPGGGSVFVLELPTL
ncbi:HAMP domain-containing sensor histidine kinase [uncultured Piscinibacter sp.]|uniref:sensor histidine kinase n=1 Tax=uncultured Piscinibacter sp. TaxID=1131835 RepID=UPI0026263BEC|nr:HAMP domain-containing sensor histidine kinase [uncultured Piscinibacter sp.]